MPKKKEPRLTWNGSNQAYPVPHILREIEKEKLKPKKSNRKWWRNRRQQKLISMPRKR